MRQIIVGPEDRQRPSSEQHGFAPRLDYQLVAERWRSDVVRWYPSPQGFHGKRPVRIARSFLGNLAQAIKLLHTTTADHTMYSTGETWGMPLALVGACRQCRHFVHVAYVHRVFSPRWLGFLATMRRTLAVDGWICVTSRQAELLRKILGKREDEIVAIPQGVDTQFFSPAQAVRASRNQSYVLCIGAEMRDYALLFEAIRGRGIRTVVKASSAWMVDGRSQLSDIPENVDVITRNLSYVEIRELYAGASMVVVPLRETLQAAGITTILESMAMQKCVVATKSPGLPDVLEHDNTGVIVESQAESFGQMIARLLAASDQREELAEAGRRAVESKASIEAHAEQIVEFLSARTVKQK